MLNLQTIIIDLNKCKYKKNAQEIERFKIIYQWSLTPAS